MQLSPLMGPFGGAESQRRGLRLARRLKYASLGVRVDGPRGTCTHGCLGAQSWFATPGLEVLMRPYQNQIIMSAIGHSIIRAALNRNVDEQVQIVMLVIGHSMLDAIGLTCGSESYPVTHLCFCFAWPITNFMIPSGLLR